MPASLPSNDWLTVFAASKLVGCARASLTAAVLRGELPAYCKYCHRRFTPSELTAGHTCTVAVTRRKDGRYPLVLRSAEVKRFSVSPTHRAAGLKSARARAKAR
jgi:hypothetical protein